jgi:hypothetical protein
MPFTMRGQRQDLLLDGNGDLARGAVWASALLARSWAPRLLQQVAERCLRESRGRSVRPVAVRGEKVPFACFYALARIATPEAMTMLNRFVQTFDNQTVVNRILDSLKPVAAAQHRTV